ncbi:uncharacterized protein L3040_006518 [Drepanopeziza brunnea f. sp. 'multigermtubi']|uniref:uncharacterized protein n=1 Tax=Drepanopeziza brunnea f. sp. 'multigermtubi' TaxID=698441 RepID=UPI0023869A15|nr:hypothetical protein L3040_006518 [Drepanopeziza brunnea f. sp. 'multigermtubi']
MSVSASYHPNSDQKSAQSYTSSSQRALAAPSITPTTSSYQSSRPLVDPGCGYPQSSTPRTARAWSKTKRFLSSLGEPPTAGYERQQAAKGITTDGKDALGATDYGPYRAWGPFGGRT